MKAKFWPPVLVFLAAMMWATDAPFRLLVSEQLPSSLIVFIEHGLSLIVLLLVSYKTLKDVPKLSLKAWVSLIVIGAGSSALALICFTQSFHYLNPSAAILLQKLQPFIAVLLAYTLLKENLSKKFWLLALLAITGAYLISFPNLVPQTYIGEAWNPHFVGIMLAVAAAVLWAMGTVFGRIVLREIPWKATTLLRFVVGFIFLGIWNGISGDISLLSSISLQSYGYLFIMSMVSGAVGLLIYYRGLRATRASIATIAELGFVVAAVLVNFFFIDATLAPMQIVGMILVLIAVLGLAKKQEVEA